MPQQPALSETTARYAVSVGSVIAGLALRLALAGILSSTVPYITFFPAVMFAAWFGGFGPGILATALSLAAAFFLVIPPSPGPAATLTDTVGGIVFVGVSIFISALNQSVRRSRADSEKRLEELTVEAAARSRAENQLRESSRQAEHARDLFQTTLASIGDAVIATDAQGKITFLNAIAQQLTGWSQAEALGKSNSEVFRIRDERTGQAAENPIEQVIRDGALVRLANHTVLITKDGREIHIEDSAAPIRDTQQRVLGVVLVFRDVTGRKTYVDAVQRSEERLKLALDAGQIGVWDWDIVKNRIEWSDLVYDIHGVERGKFSGGVDDFARLVHSDDAERVSLAIAATLQHGAPYDVEFRVIHPNGNIAWVSTTAVVFRNEQGEPFRMLGATSDITARKQAETHLKQQWRTFDTALSNTPDFTYIFDLDGRFTYINRALLSLWQLPLEAAVGKNFFELQYPPDLAERLQRQIQEVIQTKALVRDQTPFTGPTGETRHYEYIFVPVLAADGRVEAVAGSTRDITERTQAEEALRISEERLTFALEAGGGVGAFDWDIPSDLLYCNTQFARLFSVDPDLAVSGAPLSAFMSSIHADDQERVGESVRQAMQSGGDFAEEYRVLQPDGSVRWVYSRGKCNLDAAGRPARFPGVVFDITDRKRAEEDLRRSNQELQRVNRELEEFAFVASHDLQEPMRMVKIYTQILLKELQVQDPNLNMYAGFIEQGVTRMEALIRDLLTFSQTVHSDQLPIGTADLSASLAEALSVLKNRIEESGSVITAGPLPKVRGDTSQLAHVFQNLIANSLKYRKKGVPAEIQISASPDGPNWIVSLSDNGIGFEQQYAERIFGLFKRLHKVEYEGTGLGLAICKRIVERYGGSIWAEGRPGVGATFHIALPAAEDDPK